MVDPLGGVIVAAVGILMVSASSAQGKQLIPNREMAHLADRQGHLEPDLLVITAQATTKHQGMVLVVSHHPEGDRVQGGLGLRMVDGVVKTHKMKCRTVLVWVRRQRAMIL